MTSSHSTASRPISVAAKSTFEVWATAVLRGLAQVAFCDRALSGALILAATALIAPWSAAGALIGSAFGTAVGRWRHRHDQITWRSGLLAYNPAITGMIWGGVLAQGGAAALLFPIALAVCIAIEGPLARLLASLKLPPLALAAVLVGWGSDLAFSSQGLSFWAHPGALPFGEIGVAAAIVLVMAALWPVSAAAACLTAAASLTAAVLGAMLLDGTALGLAPLWAYSIAPAGFGLHAVFFAGSRAGAGAGLSGAAIAAAVWLLWISGPLGSVMPPLLLPVFVAVWAILAIVRLFLGVDVFLPRLWPAARAVRAARSSGRSVVALTGAGVSTASGIPDYVSGHWGDPDVPAHYYQFGQFLAWEPARAAYWRACDRFRGIAGRSSPNTGHMALARLERAGVISAVITQNVDRLHQRAGSSAVIELHGRIDQTHCLSCGTTWPWPPVDVPGFRPPVCADCGGLIKPAVIAMGEDLAPLTWIRAVEAVQECGVLLVIGTRLAVTSAAALVATARENGARIVLFSVDPGSVDPTHGDLVVLERAETALPALSLLVDPLLPRRRRTELQKRPLTAPAAGVSEE